MTKKMNSPAPNHDTELEEILLKPAHWQLDDWNKAKAALHTYLYKQTLELIGKSKHAGIHGVLGWNSTDCLECHNRKLRKAAAERWGQ